MSCEERVFAAVDWIVVAWLRFCVALLLAPVAVLGLILFAAMWLEERWIDDGPES